LSIQIVFPEQRRRPFDPTTVRAGRRIQREPRRVGPDSAVPLQSRHGSSRARRADELAPQTDANEPPKPRAGGGRAAPWGPHDSRPVHSQTSPSSHLCRVGPGVTVTAPPPPHPVVYYIFKAPPAASSPSIAILASSKLQRQAGKQEAARTRAEDRHLLVSWDPIPWRQRRARPRRPGAAAAAA
jgi:hypothetical protein